MAVIKEYMNGNCKIRVHDDAIRPPEEAEKIIDNYSRIILHELQSRELQKKREEKGNVSAT